MDSADSNSNNSCGSNNSNSGFSSGDNNGCNGKKRRLDLKLELKEPIKQNNEVKSWQECKPLVKERLSYLVNNERLSDITFLVGGTETPIFGHKTILSASSPYFETLFYGPMAMTERTLKITDLEPEVFLEFLKYLYTDEFDVGMDDVDALLMLKPAKIYIVPHLATKCTDLLITKLSPENVFLIYNRAIIFDEPILADVCMRFIDRQIDKVIQTEEFLDIDVETLCCLLERENLRINECCLFKAVLSWSEAECKRLDKEMTPENERCVLGRALHLVRFPSMTQEEFSIEVVPKNILSKDEIISVFMNLCIGSEQKPATPFSTTKRIFKPKLHYLNRFSDVLSKVLQFGHIFSTGDNVYNSSVKFRADQRIFAHGVGVYAVSSSISGLKFSVLVQLFKGQTLLGTKSLEGIGRNYDFRMPFQIMFERPMEIRPMEDYNIAASLKIVREGVFTGGGQLGFAFSNSSSSGFGGYGSHQIDAYYGTKSISQTGVDCNEGIRVNFTFPIPFGSESFSSGQIPQIIFSV